jgi:hypothetical protein
MLTQFDANSAARIGRVVRTVEGQFPRARPLTFGPLPDGGNSRPVFRICTFSAVWNKGSSKTVTFKYGSTATASAMNLFANVPAPTGTAHCAIARDGTAWFLIAAEC